ncbi:MAG: response regulator transcription factor [Dermatophilus congolensis]|nr:response regulator transcription factor [Dermatophilus congolensis]
MTPKPVALVVDDEAQMRDIVTFALETQGFETRQAATVEEAWALLGGSAVDLVILDVMLPGESGIDLCRRICATSEVPVILLTALGDTQERIAGLEAGAADYVAKPFHPRELALRASGLVRRRLRGDGTLRCGPLRIDTRASKVFVGERRVELTHNELRVLAALMEHQGETLSYHTLLLLGWDDADLIGGRELLKTVVYRLRLKIESARPRAGELIRNVRGVGYVLDLPETSVTDL